MRAHGDMEHVAVHAAFVEDLVAQEATHGEDCGVYSTSGCDAVASPPHTQNISVPRRFVIDDLEQFSGVDNVASRPDPAEDTG